MQRVSDYYDRQAALAVVTKQSAKLIQEGTTADKLFEDRYEMVKEEMLKELIRIRTDSDIDDRDVLLAEITCKSKLAVYAIGHEQSIFQAEMAYKVAINHIDNTDAKIASAKAIEVEVIHQAHLQRFKSDKTARVALDAILLEMHRSGRYHPLDPVPHYTS